MKQQNWHHCCLNKGTKEKGLKGVVLIRANFSELFPTDEDKHQLIGLYHLFDNDKANLYERFAGLIKDNFDVEIEQQDMERFRSWFKRVRQVLDKEYTSQEQATPTNEKAVLELLDKVKLEKIKVRQEKNQISKYENSMARTQLIMEYIDDALDRLPRFEFATPLPYSSGEREAGLLLSDLHWGQVIRPEDIWPLYNEFDNDVFKKRMEFLADQVIRFCDKEDIERLHIMSLGDELENDNLFANQVNNISERVVDQLINYSEYKSAWLQNLSRYLRLEYYIVPGNHTRLTPKRKDALRENNWTRISASYIQNRFKNEPNINVKWTDSNFSIVDIMDYTILCAHGHEVGNLDQAIQEYITMFGIDFDALAIGHYHSPSMREIHGRDVMVNGCLVGTNEFSIQIRKTSRPSQKLFVVEKGVGRTLTWDVKLDKV